MGTTRRATLALSRPQAGHLRLRLSRAAVVVAALAAAAGALYLAARETSVFAVREIEVGGVSDDVAAAARAALAPLTGASLVSLDAGEVERRLRAVPMIRSAEIDRDFPHTLRVTAEPERPVAVVRRGADVWLVAASGRIMRRVEDGVLPRLPRVWLGEGVVGIAPGKVLPQELGGAAVRALAGLPEGFPARVDAARGSGGSLTLVLPGELELRLGDTADLELKLEVAAAVLASLSRTEREALGYLDVSLPTRPTAGSNSQLVS